MKETRSKSPEAAAHHLLKLWGEVPSLALILGSGFGEALKEMPLQSEIPYAQVPGFPVARVPGHAGVAGLARRDGLAIAVFRGRAHYYEGHGMDRVCFAVNAIAAMGTPAVLLTNAAGGLKPGMKPGDFMALTDHINLMGENPLRGSAAFVDMCNAYDPAILGLLKRAARQARVRLHQGVYCAVSGPSYETPAEIRAFRKLGADAVGMSTVPEVIAASRHGMRVAALSCITNMGAGISRSPISHQEVLGTLDRVSHHAGRLLLKFINLYAGEVR